MCTLFYFLGPDIEVPKETDASKVSSPVSLFLGLHESKKVVVKLSALFMLDAFAGSFVLQSIMSGWFHVRYISQNQFHTLGMKCMCKNSFESSREICVHILQSIRNQFPTMLCVLFSNLFKPYIFRVSWSIEMKRFCSLKSSLTLSFLAKSRYHHYRHYKTLGMTLVTQNWGQ